MIILRNNSHGGIIFLYNLYGNVYDRFKELKSILAQRITYYLTAYFDKKKNHFSELSISRFSTYMRKGLF